MKNTYYKVVNNEHIISMATHSGTLIKDLLVNVEFFIEDFIDDSTAPDPGSKALGYNIDPGVKSEYCDFSIIRNLNKKCRVKCWSGFEPGLYDLDISIVKFFILKEELILKRNKMNPNIEAVDPDNFTLTYSIEVDCKTVGEAIEAANNYDKVITTDLINAVSHIPDLLRYALGIIPEVDLKKILSTSGIKI